MVDYSKWNNFGDDEDDDETFQGPRVTTFEGEKGRSFVIGPSGVNLIKSKDPLPPSLEKTALEEFQLDSTNGGVTEFFTWSQDRHEVCVRKIVPSNLKASNVQLHFEPSQSSLSAIDSLTGTEFFRGILRYKFEINDEDDLCPVQWELVTTNYGKSNAIELRVLEIIFKKISPIPGSIIWWKNVFIGEPEIDVTAIAGRGPVSKEISGAWDEAHKLFRERIATRELINVELDDETITET